MNDSEDECFESAEESLDEEENSQAEEKLEKYLGKSESEVVEPVVSISKTVAETKGEDALNNSTQYRKRPERIKRLSSKSPTRIPQPKKPPGNESFFKADIQPDVLFQGITSNLSRNINESLNTLQQKSSNVKDLILSSLPVPSANENDGFSYEDTKVTFAPASPPESDDPNIHSKNLSDEVPFEAKTKPVDIKKPARKETKNSRKNVEVKDRKPPDIKDEKSDSQELGDFVKEKSVLLPQHSLPESNSIESTSEIIKCEKLETKSNDENISNSDKISESINSSIFDSIHEKDEELSESMNDKPGDDLIACVDTKGDGDQDSFDISDLLIKDSDIDVKCSVEVIKTALQSIVKDDVDFSKEKKTEHLVEESVEKEPDEDKFMLGEVEETVKEGWDDFDFSDNEIQPSEVKPSSSEKEVVDENKEEDKFSLAENVDFSEERTEDAESVKKQESVSKKTMPLGRRIKNVESKPESPKTEEKSDDYVVKGKNLFAKIMQEENQDGIYNVEEDIEGGNVREIKSVKDGWDWESWDDISESVTSKADSVSTNSGMRDELADNNKWSGWDNFGKKEDEGWNLGSWGVNMLLNKATAVTQGISSVLEAGLGAPDPETLARMEKEEKEKLRSVGSKLELEEEPSKEVTKKNSLTDGNLFGITSLVAGVTSKIVEQSKIQEIGSKVISGGLDTLETFGRKTMEVLQEGDPGLKQKRALLLGPSKPVLSQVLKEAREKADRELKKVEEKELAKKCHFETLFDDYQGLVHLEALEMLSRQCEFKLEQIRSGMNSEEQEDLDGILEEVEQLCSLDDDDGDMNSSVMDFKTSLKMAVNPLSSEISVNVIIQIHEKITTWLNQPPEGNLSSTLIHQKLVSTLAELTTAIVHQFHKGGELLTVKECRKTVEEVDSLSKLTTILCMEINKISKEFTSLVRANCKEELTAEEIKSLSEKISVGMKNSTSYIRQAFNLLIPVLQVGAAV